MGWSYTMILVPAEPRLRPAPQQVADFLAGLDQLGALAPASEVHLREYPDGVRDTGEPFPQFRSTSSKAPSVAAVLPRLAALADYDVELRGQGPLRLLPMREFGLWEGRAWQSLEEGIATGQCDRDYDVEVTCSQRGVLVSLSTESHEYNFCDPCGPDDTVGAYQNPETGGTYEVPGAGFGTFWISVTIGRGLRPRFTADRTAFAEPQVLRLAERVFGTAFLEGCSWG